MENPHQARFGERPTTQFDALASHIHHCLGEMSNTQTSLSSTRKELLIERERVKTAAGEVRQKRVNAGDAEARFMNHVREFINNHLGQLPATLFEAYDKVRETRDDLGEVEADYIQAEDDLNGADWIFMNRENRFYQFDINRILLDSQLNNHVPIFDQPFGVVSKPPIHDLSPCPAGSLSPSQVSKLPPPPPPPHVATPFSPLVPHINTSTPLLAPIGREHPAVMEMESLRREFGKLSQRETYDFEWAGGDEAFRAEGENALENHGTASTSDHRDISLDYSSSEAKAQRTKMEELELALNESVLTRRYSDSMHLFSSGSNLSAPMRRTQTESAVPFNRCSPAIGHKIREWSLTHLKQSAIQKRLYLNALEDNGIDSSAEGDWKARASHFWSTDSLNAIRDSSELYAAPLSRVSFEPESCSNVSSTQSITSSLLMQHRLEGNIQPPKLTTADLRPSGSHGMPRTSCENVSTTEPLSYPSLPSHRVTEQMETKDEDQVVIPIKNGLDEQQHVSRDDTLSGTVIYQPKCTCLAVGCVAPRKDSVQSTHQPNCAMATEHDRQIKTNSSAQEHDDAESMTKVTMDRHFNRTNQNRSVDLDLSLPSSPDYGKIVDKNPDLDVTAHLNPASPFARLSTLSAPVIKGTSKPTANQMTSNPQPTPQARRNTITWVRSLFPHFKNKRSKSSPSIGEYHPTAHADV